jgi:hypothetical protein
VSPRLAGLLIVVAGGAMASCSAADPESASGAGAAAASPERVPGSAAARATLDALRARYVRRPVHLERGPGPGPGPGAALPAMPAVGPGVATAFERSAAGVRPVVARPSSLSTARVASVTLPLRAGGAVRVEDEASHLAMSFTLRGAADAEVEVADGLVLYAHGGPGGAHVVHRPLAEGTEDLVVFAARPAREELRYDLDVTGVPGLRLVSDTLELLDEGGTPRLRIAPPSVVDAGGNAHAAALTLEGCAADSDPRAPWGRPVTPPGAGRCVVTVAWAGAAYPLVVDPGWTTTGSMPSPHLSAAAARLGDGRGLVTGGVETGGFASAATLYDPATGTWAATGAMTISRAWPTASLLGSGKVLVAGGVQDVAGSHVFTNTAELYDPATGTWSATGSLVGGVRALHRAVVLGSGSLSAQRYNHSASVLGNGKVLVAGGGTGGMVLDTAEIYDPALGTWSAADPMPGKRVYHAATTLQNGNVLLAGGSTTRCPSPRRCCTPCSPRAPRARR